MGRRSIVKGNPNGERAAVHLRVVGRVQGVGFRYYIVRHAERLRLEGYARNREDGTVEIRAEGSPEALSDLIEAARQGPRGSRVDDVRVEDHGATNAFDGFSIRY